MGMGEKEQTWKEQGEGTLHEKNRQANRHGAGKQEQTDMTLGMVAGEWNRQPSLHPLYVTSSSSAPSVHAPTTSF